MKTTKEIREAEKSLRRYMTSYKGDMKYYKNSISLYGRAFEKKEKILNFLENKPSYKGIFKFHPDFFAGLNRIEVERLYTKRKGARK